MILVTGGTGLVGAHLLYAIVNSGEQVRAIHRKSSDLKAVRHVFSFYSNEPELAFSKIEWIEADITEVPSLEKAFKGITQVYHCAAYISFNPRHFSKLKKVNVEGTANVVNFCLTSEVSKLCYISSIATLGSTSDNSAISENSEFNPEEQNSVYAITKHEAEMEVWRGTQEGLDAVIVHPGVIIGEGIWKSASASILHTINKGMSYYTSGSIGIVDVKDVVNAMLLAQNSTIKNEAFILVSTNITFKDLLSKFAAHLNVKAPTKSISKKVLILIASLDWMVNKLFKTRRKLLKATVRSLYNERSYDGTKIKQELDFSYTPLEKTIERISLNYRRDFN